MQEYVISMWMLVALVILPYLFGLLSGIRIYEQKLMLNKLKKLPISKLKDIIAEQEEHGRE